MPVKIETKKVKLSEIKLNPDNPRRIGTEKVNHRQTVFTCRECGISFKTKKACKSRVPVYCSWSCYMKIEREKGRAA